MKKNLTIIEVFNLALQNHKKKNYQVAIKLYNKILKINPNHVSAHNNLGLVFKALEENQKAISCYEKAIEINPNYANAHNNLGLVFNALEENQKAISCYEKAIEINPNYANAHHNLGNTQNVLKEYQKAISCYEKTIEINPNHPNAHFNLGFTFKELGEDYKAISCYKKAIEINPNNVVAHSNLGTVLHGIGQYKNAAEQFRLINSEKNKSYLLSCLYKLGDKSIFFKELDDVINQGEINAMIGSLSSRSEIRYGINRPNPFCKDPLKYVLKTSLIERYDFKNIFVESVRNILNEDMVVNREQNLLNNGQQTAGNLFSIEGDFIDEMKNVIHSELEKYRFHFKNSEEGLIRSWPDAYRINGWLVSMKSGGKLSAHMHDYGWLSGSIYINVPPKLKTDSGNLVVCIDDEEHETTKNANQKKIIDVVTGNLCLFPSSLYHYTIPFESEEDRIVLAFDVISNP